MDHFKKNRVISNVVDSLIKEKTFKSSNGKQIRDFMYVSDLVSLIKIILRKKALIMVFITLDQAKVFK